MGRVTGSGIGTETRRLNPETYDRTRKPTDGKRYNDDGGNAHIGTFPRWIFRYMGVNNCAADGEVDNDEYVESYWNYRQYQGDRPSSRAYRAEHDSPIELELPDVAGWNTDSDVGGYLVSRQVSEAYRGAKRPGGGDVVKTCDRMNVSRKYRNKNERPLGGI